MSATTAPTIQIRCKRILRTETQLQIPAITVQTLLILIKMTQIMIVLETHVIIVSL